MSRWINISKEVPAHLTLVDPSDKTRLADLLSEEVQAPYYDFISAVAKEVLGGELIVSNANT